MKKMISIFKEGSGFKVFFLCVFFSGLSFGLLKGVQDNYFAEIVGMGEFERGVAEFFRELPGLLIIFVFAALYQFSAERLFKFGSLLWLIGATLVCLVPPTKVLVTASICLYSLGEHIHLSLRSSLSLEYAKEGHGGESLGYSNSLQQIGTLLGLFVVILFFKDRGGISSYKPFFYLFAATAAIALLFSFGLHGNADNDAESKRFYLKKKFRKYYMLEVFYGARKQVFFTFGPYVLILFYGADAKAISTLFAISAIACFFLSPLVGKLIDRIGYKPIMIGDTLILVIVCFFYGFAHHIFSKEVAYYVCCANYVLDAIISLASLASNVYVQDIADSPDEVKKTISTGLSVNHTITIAIALFGGWIWKALGMETLFILSAILGLCNSAYAASIKVPNKKLAE